MTNRTRLVSGRVPVSNSSSVTLDRYQYLDLSSAEPNLGTANTGDILTYDPNNPGQRKWLSQNTVAGTIGISAFAEANLASANTVYISGVDAWQNTQIININTYAGSAYDKANNALPTSGGTISNSLSINKDLTVSGNLTVLGNSTVITTSQLDIGDSLIYLANNNHESDIVDIGLVAHYNDGANAHTGIIRDPNLKEWIFFKGYTPEVQSNNVINISHPSFAYSNVYASYFKGNLITNGLDIFNYTQSAFDKANNALPQSGGTITGNLAILGANVALGDAGNVHIYGGNTGQLLSTDNFGNLEWIDLPTPDTVTYTANSLVQTNGVYVSGNLWSTTVFGDYGQTDGAYVLTDGSGSAPAWYINFDFINVDRFNRVVLDINYTQSSGHTIYVQLYNTVTTTWDSIGTYTGLGSYYAFALEVIDEANYVSAGIVKLRLYHSNGGNTSHQTSIDYVALEQSYQGPQGPRGPTGPTGATGQGVATGGIVGQVLIKNSSTNYDTSWSNNLIDTTANTIYTQGVDAWQNTQITSVNTLTQSSYNKANSANVLAQAAFDAANTAIGMSGSGTSGYTANKVIASNAAGYLTSSNVSYSTNGSISTSGNVYANSVYSDNLFYAANGLPWQISGGGSGGGSGTLSGLTDVSLANTSNNDVLTFNTGTAKWNNTPVLLDKQYTKVGILVPYTDQANRFWPSSNIAINSIVARVGTASIGNDITISLCKNLIPVANLTITAATYGSNTYTTPVTANVGDYISININTVGNLVPGADLYVTMKYYKT
jgi:hypothetical protein